MNGVRATLHGPGVPGAGVPCVLGFDGDAMTVAVEAETMRVTAEALSVTTGGADDDAMLIGWTQEAGTFSAVVFDAAAQQALVDAAPAAFAPQFTRGHGSARYQRRKWRAVLWTLGVVGVAIVVAWWQSEALTAWLASKVPVEREERFGQMLLTQLQAEGGLRDEGPAVDAVREIGTRLTRGSRYRYQWFVKEDPEINAFAGPGGIVVVHSGLIAKAESADELAGVLAHEVQHVERRHSLQLMIHSAGWAAILAVTLGDVSAITGVFIHQIGNLRHSRELEREADADGVAALARAGIPPASMTKLMERLLAEEKRRGTTVDIPLLSTHPATDERVAEVARLVAATKCDCRQLDIDWAPIRKDAAEMKDDDEVSTNAR